MARPTPQFGGRMREPFDPDRVFIIVREMKVAGKAFKGGDQFDRTLVPTRRLRQMYEARMLKMGDAKAVTDVKLVEVAKVKQPPPDFKALSNRGLRQWLEGQTVEAPPRANHAALVELAKAKWEEIQNGEPAANRDSQHSCERLQGSVDDRDAAA